MNGDGLGELIIGGPNVEGTGRVYVLFGWDANGWLGARDGVLGGDRADNTLAYTGAPRVAIDGGHGTDTLLFTGSGLSLDLRPRAPLARRIETIDLGGRGKTLLLDDAVVRRLPQRRPGSRAMQRGR